MTDPIDIAIRSRAVALARAGLTEAQVCARLLRDGLDVPFWAVVAWVREADLVPLTPRLA